MIVRIWILKIFLAFSVFGFSVSGVRDELYDAVFYANHEEVEALLKSLGDDTNQSGHPPVNVNRLDVQHNRTALMMCGMYDSDAVHAVKRVDADCAKIAALLKNAGTNMTHVDRHNWDALHMGAVRGFTAFCHYLIKECDAIIDRPDNDGLTPLMKAAAHGFFDTFKMLFEAGSDISQKDHKGRTSVHFAVQLAVLNEIYLPYLEKVLTLLGVSGVSVVDEPHLRTPLHYALIGKGSHQVAKLLLEKGADPEQKDGFGVSPIQMTRDERTRVMLGEFVTLKVEHAHQQWLQDVSANQAQEL